MKIPPIKKYATKINYFFFFFLFSNGRPRKMKRARTAASELTGGTGDVNPQYLTIFYLESAPNPLLETMQVSVPISRLQEKGGKATVLEVLWVEWTVSHQFDLALGPGNTSPDAVATLSTTKLSKFDLSDPTVFASYFKSYLLFQPALPATPNGKVVDNGLFPVRQDLTDGAGHGILVATDNIYLSVSDTDMSLPTIWLVKIAYRFKNVPLQEYIGIVQSQSR